MKLEKVLFGLQTQTDTTDRARELGRLGFMQWLAGLPGDSNFQTEALRAYTIAQPFIRTDPPVAVFCELLVEATRMPPRPMDLTLPRPGRRGGAKARRLNI